MGRLYSFRILLFSIAIISASGRVLLDGETPDGEEFTDEGMSVILAKLNEIQQKVNKIESQLTLMTNTENVNVQQLVAQTVKEYEMQRSLERISQKVEDLSISQNDLRVGMTALTKNIEESFLKQQNAQKIDSPSIEINMTNMENLLESYTKKVSSKIGFVESGLLTIATESRNLRESQKKSAANMENFIATENLKVIEHFKKNSEEVIRRLETLQKDTPSGQSNTSYEVASEKTLEKLEKDLKEIRTSLQENYRNQIKSQIEVRQDLRENRARITTVISLIEQEIPKAVNSTISIWKNNAQTALQPQITGLTKADLKNELMSLKNTIGELNNTVCNIADYLIPAFDNCTTAIKSTNLAGVYKIFIPHTSFGAFEAHCMTDSKNGSGWTVIQRRFNGSVDFNRTWNAYKHGFGDPNGEYWLGLEKIHALTSRRPHMLWIELQDFEGNVRRARYSHFEIGNESERYYLKKVGTYNGDAEDSLGYASEKRKFTTRDLDNDEDETRNCAVRFLGAWWYDNCNWSSLNGQYNNTGNGKGLNWSKWHGYEYSLKKTTIAIRVVE